MPQKYDKLECVKWEYPQAALCFNGIVSVILHCYIIFNCFYVMSSSGPAAEVNVIAQTAQKLKFSELYLEALMAILTCCGCSGVCSGILICRAAILANSDHIIICGIASTVSIILCSIIYFSASVLITLPALIALWISYIAQSSISYFVVIKFDGSESGSKCGRNNEDYVVVDESESPEGKGMVPVIIPVERVECSSNPIPVPRRFSLSVSDDSRMHLDWIHFHGNASPDKPVSMSTTSM